MPVKNIKFVPFVTPMDYHYNPDDGLWYDIDTDTLPLPTTTQKIVSDFNIDFFNGDYDLERPNTSDDFKECADEVMTGCPNALAFSFICKVHEKLIDCYLVSNYLPDITQFIYDISQNKFAFIYLRDYSHLKLLAWPVPDNQIRFVIQYYYPDDFGRDTEWKFLDRILDIQVDKQLFIDVLNKAKTQAHYALNKLLQDFAEQNNLPSETVQLLSDKMGLM